MASRTRAYEYGGKGHDIAPLAVRAAEKDAARRGKALTWGEWFLGPRGMTLIGRTPNENDDPYIVVKRGL